MFGREVTEPLLLCYDVALDDLPDAEVQRSIIECMRSRKFCPTAAELRETISGAPDAIATRAFSVLSSNVDSYKTLAFEDQLISAVVRLLGGVARIADMSRQDFDTWYRKEFIRQYVNLLQMQRPVGEMGRPLVGIIDATNHTMCNVVTIPCDYRTGQNVGPVYLGPVSVGGNVIDGLRIKRINI